MAYFPDHRPVRLRPAIILCEVAALVAALSVIALSNPGGYLWLVGVILILVHTILFYRLGRMSERGRAQSSPDFFRGLKQGLMGRRD
jgi:hypothetical protein